MWDFFCFWTSFVLGRLKVKKKWDLLIVSAKAAWLLFPNNKLSQGTKIFSWGCCMSSKVTLNQSFGGFSLEKVLSNPSSQFPIESILKTSFHPFSCMSTSHPREQPIKPTSNTHMCQQSCEEKEKISNHRREMSDIVIELHLSRSATMAH